MPWFRNSSYSPSESSVDDYNTQLTKDDITPRTYGLFRHHTSPEDKDEVFIASLFEPFRQQLLVLCTNSGDQRLFGLLPLG